MGRVTGRLGLIGALALLALVPASAASPTATSGNVVVVAKGWTQRRLGVSLGAGPYAVGAVIRNRSRTRDALNVSIDIEAIDRSGLVAPGLSSTFAVIHAGQTVYMGWAWGDGVDRIQRLRPSVHVVSEVAKRYRLPPVTDIRVNRATGKVTASVTNPYNKPLSIYLPTTASTVLFDRGGKVIGGGVCDVFVGTQFLGPEKIKPGGRANVECSIPEVVAPARVASARVTVALQNL